MKNAILLSVGALAGLAALLLLLRHPDSSDETAQPAGVRSDAGETCKDLDGIQQTTYLANCDVTFIGFTVPVSITATLYATDRGQTLSLGQSSELTVCAELSLSKDVLQAVDAAHAEPEVDKGVFVLAATNAEPKLIPQAVPAQPIGEEPVRTEVLETSLLPQGAGSIELTPRGAAIDILVTFKGDVKKKLALQIPSQSCPKGFEPVGDSTALSFLVTDAAEPENPASLSN